MCSSSRSVMYTGRHVPITQIYDNDNMPPLVETLSARLEALIDAEIGADTHAWVPEKPLLLGLPRWRGDAAS